MNSFDYAQCLIYVSHTDMQRIWMVLSDLLSSTAGIHIASPRLRSCEWKHNTATPLLVLNVERTGASPFGCPQTYRVGVKEEVDGGREGVLVPFSSRALILGVSGGAVGHVSLISSVVRVWWLAGSPSVEQSGEDAVKMAAHGVFLLINPDGGVRVWGVGSKTEKNLEENSAVQFNNCHVCVEHCFHCTLWCTHLC